MQSSFQILITNCYQPFITTTWNGTIFITVNEVNEANAQQPIKAEPMDPIVFLNEPELIIVIEGDDDDLDGVDYVSMNQLVDI